jgi:anoctamin-4
VSPTGDLNGFVEFSMSKFDIRHFTNHTRPNSNVGAPEDGFCYYRDYRDGSDGDYERSKNWYKIWIMKVCFVLIFEQVVYLMRDVIAWWVPDVPKDVQTDIKREIFKGREALFGEGKVGKEKVT